MAHPQIVLKEIDKLVSDAKASAKRVSEDSTIPQCDAFKLTYYLGDVEEARGAAAVLAKLYPEDGRVQELWKEAVGAHTLAYKARELFIRECYCRKKV